jgi:hypothetical protein
MRRLAVLVLVVAACSGGGGADVPSSTPLPAPASSTTTLAPATPPPATVPPTSLPPGPVDDPVFLVWVSGFLPEGFAAVLQSVPGVEQFSIVSAGIADLAITTTSSGRVVDVPPDGFVFPLETFAVDPATYARFLPPAEAELLRSLGPDEVALGETSARLRRLGIGDVLEFAGGGRTTVAAVFPDELVGGAEVVTVAGDRIAPGRLTARYALVWSDLGEQELRAALAARLEPEAPLQVLAEGATPIFRHADAVRPQSWIKEEFGEFAYRDGEGRCIEIDPEWLEDNIVETELPLLGEVKCHRGFAALLEKVMGELEAAGEGDAIDRRGFLGCWNPRWISDRRGLSRHSWGVAADINFGNPVDGGPGSPVHPRLLAEMEAAGITSGHGWVQADPGHFEWYGP